MRGDRQTMVGGRRQRGEIIPRESRQQHNADDAYRGVDIGQRRANE